VKLLVDNIDLLTLSQDNSQAMPIDYYPIMNKDNIAKISSLNQADLTKVVPYFLLTY